MDKVFEALEEIGNIDLGDNPYKKFEDNKLKNVYNKEFAILYNAIAELKAIKEAEPSEALRKLDDISYLVLNEIDDLKNKELWKSYFNTIKQALLKQLSGSQYTNIVLDEAVKPSEAMECLNWLNATIPQWCREKDKEHPDTIAPIKQSLLKAQELEKENAEYKEVLDIIFEKNVSIEDLKWCINNPKKLTTPLLNYNIDRNKNDKLTEEEFDLLKQYIEKNIQKQ